LPKKIRLRLSGSTKVGTLVSLAFQELEEQVVLPGIQVLVDLVVHLGTLGTQVSQAQAGADILDTAVIQDRA
jgi:hypothetical protein